MEEFRKDLSAFSLSQLTLSILTKTGYLDRLKEEGTDEALSVQRTSTNCQRDDGI